MSNDRRATTLKEMQEARPAAVTQREKPVPAGSPRYELLERHYINGAIHEAGEEVAYEGKPGRFLKHVGGTEWKPPVAEAKAPV